MSPQRKPSYKKKSAYGNRRTMPYVPSNRPITPNLQKQNSNLLSDNSGSSNNLGSLQFQGKLMSQNTSPQPFDFKRSATKEDLKKPLEPMINPFMAKEPQEIQENADKEM